MDLLENTLLEENKLLKKKIDELQQLLITIENKVNKMEKNHEYNRMIIALNDISICFSLGYKLKNTSFKQLNEDARVHANYIDNLNDSGEIKTAKMIVLYEKIKNMDTSIREKINELYPNVINAVLLELIHVNIRVPQPIIKRVYEWWN
jgi:hypothetical protein